MTANEIIEALENEKRNISAEKTETLKAFDYAILSVRAVHEMYLTKEGD